MSRLPMSELLQDARKGGYAVPAFCAWCSETIRVVLDAAGALRAPVIVMQGPMECGFHTLADYDALTAALSKGSRVPFALHLDHGDSVARVEEALAAGFTSVMLDYSARPYDENAAALRRVVEMARPRGVTVEGEIGHVGRVGVETAEGEGASTLTEPGEARRYVADTGVDAFAVSIGNAHGHYTRLPKLDFDRLAAIRAAVDVPLVLHGGSGTPDADLARAISLGIAKVNVATDLVTAWRESLKAQWNENRNPWAPVAHAEAAHAVRLIVEAWIRRTGAAGRA